MKIVPDEQLTKSINEAVKRAYGEHPTREVAVSALGNALAAILALWVAADDLPGPGPENSGKNFAALFDEVIRATLRS